MNYPISAVRLVSRPHHIADNDELTVMEEFTHVSLAIARVFIVWAPAGAVRGEHAYKACTQFLTCPIGSVAVDCDDVQELTTFILDTPNIGLLMPQQKHS